MEIGEDLPDSEQGDQSSRQQGDLNPQYEFNGEQSHPEDAENAHAQTRIHPPPVPVDCWNRNFQLKREPKPIPKYPKMVIRPQPRTIANNPEATLPPLDFSFLHIPTLESILYEDPRSGALAPEQPASPPPPPPSTLNPQRRGRDEPEVAEKPLPKVYMATVLRLQNNEIPSVEPLPQVLSFILVNPAALTWLDLSFNALTTLDEEAFLCLPSLRTLNLHCNKIADYLELLKLQRLPPLHTLTLHGNPIEQLRFYRTFVVALLQTRNLDFSLVSNQEREKAKTWGRIHGLTDTAIDLRSLQPVMAQRLTQDDPREAAAKPAAARPKGR